MSDQKEKMRQELDRIFDGFPSIHTADIPGIDLYMDQVTTFLQENLRGLSRDPDGDKFLTKTMINNYVKNKVLFPPVKKKYSRDHMMLLLMIYYMKSFLSIGDIRTIISPIMDHYAVPPADSSARKKETVDKKTHPRDLRIRDIYEEVVSEVERELPSIRDDIAEQIDLSSAMFADVPDEEKKELQRFSLICKLSAEVYMRKLFIEKLLDASID